MVRRDDESCVNALDAVGAASLLVRGSDVLAPGIVGILAARRGASAELLRPAVEKVAGRHADAGRRHGLRAVEQVQSAHAVQMLQLVGCWLGAGWVLVGCWSVIAGCWLRARRCRMCAGSAGSAGAAQRMAAHGQRTGSARAAHGQRTRDAAVSRSTMRKASAFGSPRGIPRDFGVWDFTAILFVRCRSGDQKRHTCDQKRLRREISASSSQL